MNVRACSQIITALCVASTSLWAEDTKEGKDIKAEQPVAKPERLSLGMLLNPRPPAATELTWRMGEKIKGDLESASADEIIWKSEFFTTSMRLQREAVRRVDFSKPKLSPPEGKFRFVFLDGSHLQGWLESMSENELVMKSTAEQTITIGCDQLVSIERLSGGGVISSGAGLLISNLTSDGESRDNGDNMDPFSRSSRRSNFTPWYFEPAGRVATPSFNQKAQWQAKLPDQGMLDFSFTTGGAPAFAITLTAENKTWSVETWGDEVVIMQGTRFASAGARLDPGTRQVRLRLGWNRSSGSVVLYGSDGKVWAELPSEPPPPPPISLLRPPADLMDAYQPILPGPKAKKPRIQKSSKTTTSIAWHNKGNGMVVQKLELSEWKGQPAPAVMTGPVCIETATEQLVGVPTGMTEENIQLRLPDQQMKDIPRESIRTIRWDRAPKLAQDFTQTSLWGADGQYLRGKLLSVKDGKALLETSFAKEPLAIVLANCRALILPDLAPDAKPPTDEQIKKAIAKLDTLTTSKGVMHGQIAMTGGKLPQFKPQGALDSLTPTASNEMSITRAMPEDLAVERSPALLHTSSAETFPVSLTAISKDQIDFAWATTTATTNLKTSQIQAIQFTRPRVENQGFDGPSWQSTKSAKPKRKATAITLPAGGGIGHPYALQGEDIIFKMESKGSGSTLRIRLFANSMDQKSGTRNFLVGDFGSELYCGVETESEGQFNNQRQVPRGADGTTEIKLTFPADSAQLWVNGMMACEIKRQAKEKFQRGPGLILESGSLWGNQSREVIVKDFVMKGNAFNAAPPIFSEEAKREALLIPRVHRESPPKQILIGRNGDLLRGEIESLSATHLLFRAGMETFKVPLERVSSAVWVAKADKNPPKEETSPAANDSSQKKPKPGEAPPEEKTKTEPSPKVDAEQPVQWLDLVNGGRLQFAIDAWNEDSVIGKHPLLGECKISTALISRVTLKSPTPTAAVAALSNWKFVNTQDPVLPGDEGDSSPLLDKDAEPFSLPLLVSGKVSQDLGPALDEVVISLKDLKGKVVVLDFWATWCGPCVKSLPGLVETMKSFPEDKVAFLAVNQGETKAQVRKFLESRKLEMPVALDASQSVARKYGVDGIPHTVVISPAGKIVLVKVGFTPEGEKEIGAAVQKAMQ